MFQKVQKDQIYLIFNCMVEYIDLSKEKNLIKAARLKISRKPSEDIQIVTDKLKHIIYQQVQIQDPTLSDSKIKEAITQGVTKLSVDNKCLAEEACFQVWK